MQASGADKQPNSKPLTKTGGRKTNASRHSDPKLEAYNSKLEGCITELKGLFTILLNPEKLSQKAPMNIIKGLNKTIQAFYELNESPIGISFNMLEVIEIISDANSHILAASEILRNVGKTYDYFQHLQTGRGKIYEVLEQLKSPE